MQRIERKDAAGNTFEIMAREWLSRQNNWEDSTRKKASSLLETWAFPWIGHRPIKEISTKEILENVLRRVEDAGKLETAGRLRYRCGQIFRYAIGAGRADNDPTVALRGALKTREAKNHPSITDPKKVGKLLCAMDGYSGHFVTKCALVLSPLLMLRPGELRKAEWSDFDFDDSKWSVPALTMKMKEPHIVPLASQAKTILIELRPMTGHRKLVFPGIRDPEKPMSENTINMALRRLGYSGSEIVAHGFRTMASTLLNEKGWDADVIEAQLAHSDQNQVRRAYNRAKYLPARRLMMQAWADYLDELRTKAK